MSGRYERLERNVRREVGDRLERNVRREVGERLDLFPKFREKRFGTFSAFKVYVVLVTVYKYYQTQP